MTLCLRSRRANRTARPQMRAARLLRLATRAFRSRRAGPRGRGGGVRNEEREVERLPVTPDESKRERVEEASKRQAGDRRSELPNESHTRAGRLRPLSLKRAYSFCSSSNRNPSRSILHSSASSPTWRPPGRGRDDLPLEGHGSLACLRLRPAECAQLHWCSFRKNAAQIGRRL
jgi:hypothetical protein